MPISSEIQQDPALALESMTTFTEFVDFIATNIKDIYSNKLIWLKIKEHHNDLERCTDKVLIEKMAVNHFFANALISQADAPLSFLVQLILFCLDKKQASYLPAALARYEQLEDYLFYTIATNLEHLDYLLTLVNKDHGFMQKTLLIAAKSKKWDVVKRLLDININPKCISLSESLNNGHYLLALLAMRSYEDKSPAQPNKKLILSNPQDESEFSGFLEQLYKGKPNKPAPDDENKEEDFYYQQLILIRATIHHYNNEINKNSSVQESLLDTLTLYDYLKDIGPNNKALLKHYLERCCFHLSQAPIEKRILCLDELSSLNSEVCFTGKIERLESINSLLASESTLHSIIARYRLEVLNNYIEQHLSSKKINAVYYPHVQMNFIRVLVADGWTVLEQDKAKLFDPLADDSKVKSTLIDKDEFLKIFTEQNGVIYYTQRIVYALLDHLNKTSSQALLFDNLPYQRFGEDAKKRYKQLLESFELLSIKSDNLFELIEDSKAPQYTINVLELYFCIIIALYNQNIIHHKPGSDLIKIGQIYNNKILSLRVDGVLVFAENRLSLFNRLLNSSENNLETLTARYLDQLNHAFYNKKEDLNYYFFDLDNDTKEALLNIILKSKKNLWCELIVLATKRDKNLLRVLIYNNKNLMVNHLYSDETCNYQTLCLSFIDEPQILDILVDILPIKLFTVYSSQRGALVGYLQGILTQYFSLKDHFNKLVNWFENDQPMYPGLCRFIANDCPDLYCQLIDRALKEQGYESLKKVINYVPQNEYSRFSLLLDREEQFRDRYIHYLLHSIEQNNAGLFDLLVQCDYTMILREKEPELYFTLLKKCVEKRAGQIAARLITDDESFNLLNQRFFKLLLNAIEIKDHDVFHCLTTNKGEQNTLFSISLLTLHKKDPDNYATLIKQCTEDAHIPMLKKLIYSKFKTFLLSKAQIDNEKAPMNEDLFLAFGDNKTHVKQGTALINEQAQRVHIAYFREPINGAEMRGQLNELNVSLSLKSFRSIINGLGFLLNPDTHTVSAILYPYQCYEHSLKSVIESPQVDILFVLRRFLKELLLLINFAQENNIALSSENLTSHVLLFRDKYLNLSVMFINPSKVAIASESLHWTYDFIFQLGILPLQRVIESFELHSEYEHIKKSLIEHHEKNSDEPNWGYTRIQTLRYRGNSNSWLPFIQNATISPHDLKADCNTLLRLIAVNSSPTPIIINQGKPVQALEPTMLVSSNLNSWWQRQIGRNADPLWWQETEKRQPNPVSGFSWFGVGT